jgi:DNA-binding NtrC family response regulator
MKILIIDDEVMVSEAISDFLNFHLGHEVVVCSTSQEARKNYRTKCYPLIISDIRMPSVTGLEMMREIKELYGDKSEVVLITGHADLNSAIEALRCGALDYLPKPIDVKLLASLVKRVDMKRKEQNQPPKSQVATSDKQTQQLHLEGIGNIGFFNSKMRANYGLALKMQKKRNMPVLIEGETGTGKEIYARLIHGDENKPFVSVNCSAISPQLFESELFGYAPGSFTGADTKGKRGKFELAQGGSLFLDEIGDLPPDMQPKLLKVLQDKQLYRIGDNQKVDLDVRVICATNRNLARCVQKNQFRADLFYRINTSIIELLPLRERKEEIIPLVQMFLNEITQRNEIGISKIAPDTRKLLESYHWPGNVRQLKNAIERVCFMYEGQELRPEYFDFLFEDAAVEKPVILGRTFAVEMPEDELNLYEVEEKLVRKALAKFKGNKSRTARYLCISMNKLRRILGEM